MPTETIATRTETCLPAIDSVSPMKKYEYRVSASDDSYAGRLIQMVGRDKRVLEVGCASGSQTRALVEEMGCFVVGVEIDPVAAERARPYCDQLIVGDIETLALAEAVGPVKFDAIIFADVLEHLRDPAAALRKCCQLLKSDGCVVASIPNVTHASITYELAHGRFDYGDKGLLDDTHIRFFSKKSAIELFESADLLVERLDRKIAEPQSTEFETQPTSADDRMLLRYVFDHNPDAATYQFLIRAVPMDSIPQLRSAATQMRAQIDALEQQLHAKERELNRLQSELAWLQSNPIRGFLGALHRFFSGERAGTSSKEDTAVVDNGK